MTMCRVFEKKTKGMIKTTRVIVKETKVKTVKWIKPINILYINIGIKGKMVVRKERFTININVASMFH